MPTKINFTIERQFHSLSHFEKVDPEYMNFLINGSDFTQDDILSEMQIYGSKFAPSFAKNPLQVLSIIEEELVQQNITPAFNENKSEIFIQFDRKKYPKGIGYDILIPISKLTKSERKQIEFDYKRSNKIKTVQLNHYITTWDLNVILCKEQEPEIITFFPGRYAPPFPDVDFQSKEQFELSKNFWELHVFIKNS